MAPDRSARVLPLLCCLLIVLSAFSCTGKDPGTLVERSRGAETVAAAKREYVIGFSNGFSGNSWRAEMLASLRQEAERHPDVQLIILDGQGDIGKQVDDLEALVARRVDAIILIPNSSRAVSPILKEAIRQGIKVVHFNLPLEDPASYTVYIGPDEKERGRRWARWLIDTLGNRGDIIMLGGIPGNPGTAAALEGARETLQRSQLNVLAYRDAFWQEERARMIVAELLAEHPRVDGIWSDGGQMTAGALKALVAAGHPPVPATGDDYNGVFKFYMRYRDEYDGFDFAAISTPTWQSRVALQTAVRLLEGDPVPKWVKIEPVLINGKDAPEYVQEELSDSIFVDTDLPEEILREIK